MTNLSWERIKDLKRPVTQKTMYIAMAVMLAIGLYLGANYSFDDIPFFNKDTASIIEAPVFAQIGDQIKLECPDDIQDSKCGRSALLRETSQSLMLADWDTGSVNNIYHPIEVNETSKIGSMTIHTITYAIYQNAKIQ